MPDEVIQHTNTQPPMRSELDVYRAHDLVVGILMKEAPVEMDPESLKLLNVVASTLCWVLRHDHNTSVGEMLTYIESELDKKGIRLSRHDN